MCVVLFLQAMQRFTYAMFFHESDELSLSQVIRWAGLLFHKLDFINCECVSAFTGWHSFFQRDTLPRHQSCETCK